MIPNVTTEVAFASTPDDTTPTWTDISAFVKRSSMSHGRENELEDFSPGTNTLVLRNDDRRFDPTYAAGPYFGNLHPFRRIRQYVPGPLIGTEFWGDFEAGADGTAPEWTAMNGFVECKAGSEARQLQYVATPTPRVGSRIARIEVAPGDKFGVTTGERCEVRRGATNGGFGTGDCEGLIVAYQMSKYWPSPWTHPSGEGIFWQMHDSGSTYGQPSFRWRVGTNPITYDFRTVTGTFPNSTDAGNGVNAGTNNTHNGRAFSTDEWWDFRWKIYYTASTAGWYVAQMKKATETEWTTVANIGGVSTLQNYPGSAATSQFDKRGWYRPDTPGVTNVSYDDGYFVGHDWPDVSYTGFSTDTRLHDGWEGREQAAAQVGNPNFEADVVGTSKAGSDPAGTRTWDTTRSHTGSGSLKIVTDGTASGQGSFHTKRSLSRYDGIVAGDVVTAWAWFSGDNKEQVRVGIEFFNSGGSTLGTTFAPARALRTDFRRHWVTVTAPANAVTFRIRTSLSGTNAATFWVDDTDWIMGELDHFIFDGYIDRWDTTWPDRFVQSEVTVTATDGFKLLNAVPQPTSDPSVEDYPSVINYSDPPFYYRLGEDAGTKVISHTRTKKHHVSLGDRTITHTVKHKTHRRVTRAEVEGVSGPSGTYKNTPLLGETGAIAGDNDTSVRFRAAQSEYARVLLPDDADLGDVNNLTAEAWINLASTPGGDYVAVSGPKSTAFGDTNFALLVTSSSVARFFITGAVGAPTATGATALSTSTWHHIAGTWNGSTVKIYVNGILDGSTSQADTLQNGDAGESLYIGTRKTGGGLGSYFDGWIDEVAVYEKALEPATVLAHYTAGLRGYNQELTSDRIDNALDASGIVTNRNLATGARYVLPARQFGQPSLDPIQEAVAAEGGMSGFFFSASGVATFLSRNYRDSYPYTVLNASIDEGQSGEIEVEDVGFSHGEELLYNKVRVTADGGTLQEVSDAATPLGTIYQTFEDSGAPMVSNDDALDEANYLLSRLKSGRWRITGVTFPCDTLDLYDKLQQALFRECGDMVSITRRPGGGASFTQVSSIERVAHDIDFEANSWRTSWTVAPIADDLSTGWVLGLPSQTELDSTAVLN